MASAHEASLRGLLARGLASKSGYFFLTRAALWVLLLYGAYYYPYALDGALGRAIDAYLRLQARAAGALIGIFDTHASVTGTVIYGSFPVRIVKSCSSLDAQALYAAAVLAFPARVLPRVLGLIAGSCMLTTLNLLRIAALYFVGTHAPRAFDAVHEELLPLLLVAFATGAFALWAKWATSGPRARERSDFDEARVSGC